jgi:hypothetical protein
MTGKEQFTGLTAMAHDMRTDLFEAFVGQVGELAELDKKLIAVDKMVLQLSHEAEITHLITYRVLLKRSIEDLKAVTEAFTKQWADQQKKVDEIIIERMQAADMKSVNVDGLGKMTRASRRYYKVADIEKFCEDLQGRAVDGQDIQPYIDLFGVSLSVTKLDEMLEDGMDPFDGVESSSSASLRFTQTK